MTFTQTFDRFVSDGDAIACEMDGYNITAQIVRDDCPDPPDQRRDGFWPSLYKDAPGFIGPGKNFRQRFDEARTRAEAIMRTWREDEWFYCGIVLSVSFNNHPLLDKAASLWGVEANYPNTDNVHLTDTANELLAEAIEAAQAERARLCAMLCTGGAQG